MDDIVIRWRGSPGAVSHADAEIHSWLWTRFSARQLQEISFMFVQTPGFEALPFRNVFTFCHFFYSIASSEMHDALLRPPTSLRLVGG